MNATYDAQLVVLSVTIAVIASYTALDLAGRVTAARGRGRKLWLVGGAITTGTGIWSMHFIAMLAYRLPIPMNYDSSTVFLSLALAIIASGLALCLVSHKQLDKLKLWAGGSLIGGAIAAMHYTGMAAMQMEARAKYDLLLVTISLGVAIIASIAALWLTFQLGSATTQAATRRKKIGSALLMGGAIAGMHYIAMAAVCFESTSQVVGEQVAADRHFMLAVAIGIGTTVILVLALQTAFIDHCLSTQAALAESQRRLATLIDSLPGIVFSCGNDPGCWSMTYLSEGCLELTGYTSEELVGTEDRCNTITHSEDLPRVIQTIDAAISQQQPYVVEYRITTKSGQQKWLWEKGSGVFDSNGEVLSLEGFISDITDLKRSEKALRQAEAKYRSIFENAVEGIFQTTPDGKYISANPALARIYGYESSESLITEIRNVEQQLYVKPSCRAEFIRLIQQDDAVSGFEAQVYQLDGSIIWISENAHAVRDQYGNLLCYEGTVENITERKRIEAQLAYLANHDPLTGLFNRRHFQVQLEHHLALAQRYEHYGGLIFIDLDEFKDINDTLGHLAGDELLNRLAKLLQDMTRETDILARLGGDEFAILLPQTGSNGVQLLAQRLLEALQSHIVVFNGQSVRITASIGVSLFPEHGITADELLAQADQAMYKSKENGRNCLSIHTLERNWRSKLESKHIWKNRLLEALEQELFLLYYQPVTNLGSNQTSHYELLLRMQEADGQLISPSVFLPIAERSGLICQIDRWVVHQAIHLIAAHAATGHELNLEVNLSSKSLADDELLLMIQGELAITGINPASLILEITETAAIADVCHVQQFINTLKQIGCKFALDDFGSGYSSFSHLKYLPVDYLKIDSSFINNLLVGSVERHLVKAIVDISHGLKMATIADFVGDEETLRLLHHLGVDYAQGYYIGQPRPVTELSVELVNNVSASLCVA